jgi:CDP-glycerol glycerophosphotransferase
VSAPATAGPAVTIIVPGHNVAPYVGDALDSLRRQTRTDWTAILIDDSSTDATPALFAAAAAEDPRFKVVGHEQQRGLGAARNVGLDMVETPFLGFLDADDVLAPHALERLIGVLGETGSDFVAGAYVRLRPDLDGGYILGDVQPWVTAATAPERRGTTINEHPDATGNIVAWSKVSRTEFWHRAALRFPEGRLYEDQVVAQQMYARARRFDTVPDVIAHWRIRPDGSSITQREAQLAVLRDCLEAMNAGLHILEAGHPQAAQARIGLILRMDVPRLAEIARSHPDAAYRRTLGAFTRDVWARAGSARYGLDEASIGTIAAVQLW